MKHIDIKLDFIRCVVIIKAIKIEYISTKNQIAEVLTKGLCNTKFPKLLQCYDVYEV